jgi:hypothetical protein
MPGRWPLDGRTSVDAGPGPRPGGPEVRGGLHRAGDLVPAAQAGLVRPDGRALRHRTRQRRHRGVEEGDLAQGKRTAALGGWIVFEDESGQSLRPPRSATWARRGITPVIRVRGGGTGHVSIAGLACYRPGERRRLIYRLHTYRGRKGQTKAFTWNEYRDRLSRLWPLQSIETAIVVGITITLLATAAWWTIRKIS